MKRASSSSSSSFSDMIYPEKHDVFLSFRGEDTRDNFISHLLDALYRKKIETYIDYRLERGDEIASALSRAIAESRLSIIIFSENYASSPWCLDELVHILRSKKENGQFVVPVFYRVNPSHVRKQEGSYEIALDSLEQRFNKEKVNQWRSALTEAANLSGWDSLGTRPESKLIGAIVEDVLEKLNFVSPLDDFKGLVGVNIRAEEIITLLDIGLLGVRTVGVWGMGGIGKTTLATVVFSRLASQFESCCFLENVKEESEKHGPNHLRFKFFSKLLEEENLDMGPLGVAPTFVKYRLRRKKVLIVLDDVNDLDQLEFLVGDRSLFGHGSRIIITTRDMQILRDEADEIYTVERLNFDEALQLFHFNAFKRSSPTMDDVELSKRVVKYAKGIPLVLKVLGSYLRCKRKENWESELDKLEVVPNNKIQNVLRVSYDGLDRIEKKIFLDIACFFKGMDRDYVEKILDACGFFAKIGIDDLIDKSLIIVKDCNILWMHDLLQEMGWEIIRSVEELRKRSRLWIAQDIYHVFKHNRGTGAIEGIFLNMTGFRDIYLSPKVFEEMCNLRLLKVHYSNNFEQSKVYLPLSLRFLPNKLRYLSWSRFPLKSLPSSFKPRNLVELDMPYSQLEQLWDGVQDLTNLRHIDLSHSKNLTQVPDLSHAPNLESINLQSCTSLLRVPSLSFKTSNKFRTSPVMSQCKDLCCLIGRSDPKAFGTVDLNGCSKLKSISRVFGNMKYLHVGMTAVENFPSLVLSLDNLVSLNLSNCLWLKDLPTGIRKLESLHFLNLSGCSSLDKIPELPRNIRHLFLKETGLKHVPVSIRNLSHLKAFHLDDCKRLKSLPSSICKLKSLQMLNLHGCAELEDFPEISEPMELLENIDLRETGIKKLPCSIENIVGLSTISMTSCENLEFVPSSLYNINSLKSIFLSNCSKLENMPSMLIDLCHLHYLDLSYCNIVEIPNSLGCLSSLTALDLRGNSFASIPASVKRLSELKTLKISNCKNLRSLTELPYCLEHLNASGCVLLEEISHPRIPLIQGLDEFHVTHSWEFLFYGCLKLDKDECNAITMEFQLRVLQRAAIPKEPNDVEELESKYLAISVCFPGIEIPNWFSYQSEEPFVKIKLTPDWCNTNFLGFALCAVVAFGDYHLNCKYLCFYCEFHFKTNNGESHTLCWSFPDWENGELEKYNTIFSLEHVFMWYKRESYHNFVDAVEVSFDFLVRDDMGQLIESHYIKRCGVQLLYLQDAEEAFHFVNNQYAHGESDEFFDHPRSTGTWILDANREELVHDDDDRQSSGNEADHFVAERKDLDYKQAQLLDELTKDILNLDINTVQTQQLDKLTENIMNYFDFSTDDTSLTQ